MEPDFLGHLVLTFYVRSPKIGIRRLLGGRFEQYSPTNINWSSTKPFFRPSWDSSTWFSVSGYHMYTADTFSEDFGISNMQWMMVYWNIDMYRFFWRRILSSHIISSEH